ncbi:MAG: molybdopterin-containing oxidoreductase family protein [Candidatus Methanosuratincola sp.]|jgi:anaerobic selenocysteine-containing dehydrogenase|nr:molybdopterin-dependent oxidoreductase [Candidatus Methanosuratincola sp.]
MDTSRKFFTVCPRDCYDTCVMITRVEGGQVNSIRARADHGITRGFLCKKGQRALEYVFSPERLKYPLRRVGRKGEGKFERISWESALSILAGKMEKILEEYGPESILPYSYAGHMGLINRYFPQRLFNRIGASDLDYTICSSAGKEALRYHYGTAAGMDPEDLVNSSLVVVWGMNPAWTAQHIYSIIARSGAKVVVVDPVKTETAGRAEMHLQLKPGTDSALALGVINYAISENLHDQEFIRRNTIGFDALARRASEFTVEKVCGICGIGEGEFLEFAGECCSTKPAAFLIGLGIQRNLNGGEMVRAISLIPAVTGNIGRRGGGLFYSNSAYFTADLTAVSGVPSRARRSINMVRLGEALLDGRLDPPVRFLFVYNSNPAAVCPDQNRVREGLAREDLFTVVHDLFVTDTADYADLVLPATSFLECFDIHFTYGGLYVAVNEKAIDPIGEARSNYDLFNELSARMGYPELCESPESVARKLLGTGTGYMDGITLEELMEKGFVRLRTPQMPHVAFSDLRFRTPSGKIELCSGLAQAEGLEGVPGFTEIKGDYPIRLLSPFHRDLSKSQYHNIGAIFGGDAQAVEISREDAAARGISDGDRVRVFNARGDCIIRAKVSPKVKRGVAVTYGIAWPKLLEGGKNVNFTTGSETSDIGGCSTFHTNFVEIERA